MADAVALGIAPDGSSIPIRLTPAGLLSVSGGSGSAQGPGVYKGESFVLMGIASDGQITPIAVDSSGNIQSSGSSGGGSGTVTSVGLTVPSILSVTGSPVTSSGTLAISLATQSANTIFAGPTSGGVVAPAFRALVGADLPANITRATTFGAAASASPTANILTIGESSRGGTDTNVAGANGTIASGNGTGTGAASSILFQTSTVGSSGSVQQTLATRLTIATVGITATVPYISPAGSAGNPGVAIGATDSGFFRPVVNRLSMAVNGTETVRILSQSNFILYSGIALSWASSGVNESPDVNLYRDAANILAQRNGTTAQQFNIYNTYTDASNYERGQVYWSGNVFYILTNQLGTGSPRTLQMGTIGSAAIRFLTNNTNVWDIAAAGHFLAATDNTYDIGASGATRPRSIYVGTNVTVGGQIIAANGTTSSPSVTFIGNTNSGLWNNSGAVEVLVTGSRILQVGTTGLALMNGSALVFRPDNTTSDLFLVRDAANILAQRNGVNAQENRIYNTYTDASNYERGGFIWTSNILQLETRSSGTGSPRTLRINQLDNTGFSANQECIGFLTGNNLRWYVSGGGHFMAAANLNLWNGTAALATNATVGFLGVNSCAGVPSGTPASIPTGQIPLVMDSTNSKLMAYIGGVWKGVVLA